MSTWINSKNSFIQDVFLLSKRHYKFRNINNIPNAVRKLHANWCGMHIDAITFRDTAEHLLGECLVLFENDPRYLQRIILETAPGGKYGLIGGGETQNRNEFYISLINAITSEISVMQVYQTHSDGTVKNLLNIAVPTVDENIATLFNEDNIDENR